MKNKQFEKMKEKFFNAHQTSTNLLVTNIKKIAISDIIVSDNIRKDIKEEDIDSLAESIKNHGLLQPLIVKQRGDGKFDLIAGQRRLLACKKLNLDTVLSHILESDSDKKMLQWIENILRQDLSLYDKAKAVYDIFSERLGETVHNKIMSKLLEYNINYSKEDELSLSDVDKKIKDVLDNLSISVSTAKVLLMIFGFDDRVKELIRKYNPPIKLIEKIYKYRDYDFLYEVLKESLENNYTIEKTVRILDKRLKEAENKKEQRKRYYSYLVNINKKLMELPEDTSLIKDKEKVMKELEKIKIRAELLMDKLKRSV